jgi:hypothetical protein
MGVAHSSSPAHPAVFFQRPVPTVPNVCSDRARLHSDRCAVPLHEADRWHCADRWPSPSPTCAASGPHAPALFLLEPRQDILSRHQDIAGSARHPLPLSRDLAAWVACCPACRRAARLCWNYHRGHRCTERRWRPSPGAAVVASFAGVTLGPCLTSKPN